MHRSSAQSDRVTPIDSWGERFRRPADKAAGTLASPTSWAIVLLLATIGPPGNQDYAAESCIHQMQLCSGRSRSQKHQII